MACDVGQMSDHLGEELVEEKLLKTILLTGSVVPF